MPLPAPVSREPVHTRAIECQAFLRDDGLWDIEGHLTDHKSYNYPSEWRGLVGKDQPVHDMRIRMTVGEDFIVREAVAVTDSGPYPICPSITPNFARLEGLRVEPGWNREVRKVLGGIEGCTHLVDLLAPMATTAFQAIGGYRAKRAREAHEGAPEDRRVQARLVNSCHAWGDTGAVVKRWAPDFYRGEA